MNTYLMDECFRARMQQKKELFPIDDFREKLVDEFAKRGIVFIQDTVLQTKLYDEIEIDDNCGMMFNSQKNLNIAIRLLRRWGFSVTAIAATDEHRGCYIVQMPDAYLRNKISKDKLGIIHTGIRSYHSRDIMKKQLSKRY